MAWTFGSRAIALFRIRRVRAVRNRAARLEHSELLRFARRFARFANQEDASNLRYIVFSACGNNEEKCLELCPPDYMKDLLPLFVRHLETRPAETEEHFCLAVQELYGLVASYNNHYVLEPFRRMRSGQWVVAGRQPDPANPNRGAWLASLSEQNRAYVERQIEDFRERWAGFLDDMRQWLERVNESFGANLSTYFERPQKL